MNSRSRRTRLALATLPLALVATLGSCSSGSSGGGVAAAILEAIEPNDTPATSTPLPINRVGSGVLADQTDVDMWSVDVPANTVVSIELYGTRIDQEDWDANDSIPRVTVLDTDGTTVLLNHDFTNMWDWGKHDLDTPMVLVADAGTYYLNVSCDGAAVTDGDYAIRVKKLNLGTIQHEVEPEGTSGDNDAFADAEPIVPGWVHGFHVDEESDYYSFEITSPSVVRFEMQAYRTGVFNQDTDYYDPYLYLFDTDGTTVLFEEDDVFFYDSAIEFHIDTPGTYYIDVDQFGGSDGDAPYFMKFSRTSATASAEQEPNDDPVSADSISYGGARNGSVDAGELDGFKFTGKAGDMVRIQVFDSSNSLNKADLAFFTLYAPDTTTALPLGGDFELRTSTTILQENGTHYIVVEPFAGLTDYRVELKKFQSSTRESEPNDTTADADAMSTRMSGVIDPGGDLDLFKFNAKTNTLTTIAIYASSNPTSSDGFYNYSGHGSQLEPLLRILDSTGTEVEFTTSNWTNCSGESVTNALPTFSLSFINDPGGTFYVEVSDAFGGSGPEFYYVIEKSN